MTVLIHKDSHVDHGIPRELLEKFADRSGFFIETIETENHFDCNLIGPVTGFPPIGEEWVEYRVRGARTYTSRMFDPKRLYLDLFHGTSPVRTNKITFIAGEHDGIPCVLYTAFPGPFAPKEVNDPTLTDKEREASIAFWAEHALIS